MSPTASNERDRGAAVAEFVMMSTLLVFLLFAVLQVGLFFYVRNIAGASAADGARYAATVDTPTGDGAARAEGLLSGTVGGAGLRCDATATVDAPSGLPTTTVRCHGRLHALFLPLTLPLTVDVRSSALTEQRP